MVEVLALTASQLDDGQPAAALTTVSAVVIAQPLNARARHLQGSAYHDLGDLAAASIAFRRAIVASAPGQEALVADCLNRLGLIFEQTARSSDAAAAFVFARALAPADGETSNYSRRHRRNSPDGLRGVAPALKTLERQLQLDAVDLANELVGKGSVSDAMLLIQHALLRHPQPGVALLVAAAHVAASAGKLSGALELFERALQLEPTDLAALDGARRIAAACGIPERMIDYSRKLLELAPSDEVRVAMRLALPAIQASRTAIHSVRHDYETALDELLVESLSMRDPTAALGVGSFFLAYHGENDRELQTKAAQLFVRASPSLLYRAPHCNSHAQDGHRMRVGFLSHFLYEHSIGKTTKGLVAALSRADFEVVVIRIGPGPTDQLTSELRSTADLFVDVDMERGLAHAREQIATLQLDILFYQELGMHVFTYFLAFARLAPVQCVSYGHPNTTGIPTIDYFISNDLYETAESLDHYSEKLFLLHSLPTLAFYYRPAASAVPRSRADFGLPNEATLYLCPQTLFKIHPDMDEIFSRILKSDPRAHLVLIRGEEVWVNALTERFRRSMPDVIDRVLFVRRQPQLGFMDLLRNSDVMLDTLHFNGMNSSLEALSVGLPVVTLATSLQRGRHTRAMYLKMGITDCVAENVDDYVRIALRLGNDAFQRSAIRDRIVRASGVLFEDANVVREFERFFRSAHSDARQTPSQSEHHPHYIGT